jgi:tripartite-type tricarboxylate transporter receptor subunit TctC
LTNTRYGGCAHRPTPSILGTAAALLLASLTWMLSAQPACAEYPERLIRLIVPQAPGSATDVLARLLAAELEPQIGQSIVVENRPGGALTTGLSFTATSAPDGYTIAMGPIGALAITRHLVKKLPYDIERDFQPIALVTRGQMLLAVSPKLPVRTVAELIALAKAKPGVLVYASSSAGSPGHVGGELFKFMTGIDIVHVPYRGGSMAITDLISGQVHIMLESLSSIAPFAQSGDVRALAVSGPQRSAAFPDLPTIDEAGVPGFEVTTWNGVIGPAGMPRPVVDKLSAAINRAVRTRAFEERLAPLGQEVAGGTPEDFAEAIRRDSAKWLEVIKRSGIKFD